MIFKVRAIQNLNLTSINKRKILKEPLSLVNIIWFIYLKEFSCLPCDKRSYYIANFNNAVTFLLPCNLNKQE